MRSKQKVYLTFYGQVTDQEVADYFADILLESNQTQIKTLCALVRFAKENGFKMEKREIDPVAREKARRERKLSRLYAVKRAVKRAK